MRTLGLLGGMSWESTREYYRILNQEARAELGGLHSAKLLLHSFDFAEIAKLQHDDKWDTLGDMLANAAQGLQAAGADAVLICTNLMHKVAPQVEAAISIPLLHMVDAVAESIRNNGQNKVALLGTRFTMEEPFYRERLGQQHGIEAIIAAEADRQIVHDVIYNELCQGIISEQAQAEYIRIIKALQADGAQGMILGCTEIEQLVTPEVTDACLYDTARIHAEYAARYMLEPVRQPAKASA
mgnify:CR=1 FL=1